MIKPRRPNPDAVEFQQAAKTLPHDFLQPSDMISPSNPTTTSANQDPSNPPAALTVVLSVACGAVATCILVTVRSTPQKTEKSHSHLRTIWETLTQIVLLLLRHRSYKQPFRQGDRASYGAAAVAADKAPYLGGEARVDSSDGTALALSSPDAVVAYLPILHSRSPSLTPATDEAGRALSLTYPKRVHLSLSRSGGAMSFPQHMV